MTRSRAAARLPRRSSTAAYEAAGGAATPTSGAWIIAPRSRRGRLSHSGSFRAMPAACWRAEHLVVIKRRANYPSSCADGGACGRWTRCSASTTRRTSRCRFWRCARSKPSCGAHRGATGTPSSAAASRGRGRRTVRSGVVQYLPRTHRHRRAPPTSWRVAAAKARGSDARRLKELAFVLTPLAAAPRSSASSRPRRCALPTRSLRRQRGAAARGGRAEELDVLAGEVLCGTRFQKAARFALLLGGGRDGGRLRAGGRSWWCATRWTAAGTWTWATPWAPSSACTAWTRRFSRRTTRAAGADPGSPPSPPSTTSSSAGLVLAVAGAARPRSWT